MKSTHNTIRALAIAIGLALLVVTGTAAMMAVFSSPSPATDVYRRVVISPPLGEPATQMATGHDSVLYQRVVLADGRAQWVLAQEGLTSLAASARTKHAEVVVGNGSGSSLFSGGIKPVSYLLMVKPSGLSKPVRNCGRSAFNAYDIACNTLI